MKRDDELVRKVARLADLELEYDMTIRVLSIMVERVQQLTGARVVDVAQSAIDNQPDLTAWRNENDSISLVAAR